MRLAWLLLAAVVLLAGTPRAQGGAGVPGADAPERATRLLLFHAVW